MSLSSAIAKSTRSRPRSALGTSPAPRPPATGTPFRRGSGAGGPASGPAPITSYKPYTRRADREPSRLRRDELAMMTSNGVARVRVLALAFVVFASAGSFLIFAPSAKAAATAFQVDVGKYTGGYLFVPGETITFTLTVDNAAGQQFDVVLVDTTTNTILQQYNNTAVPASSTASLSFAVTSTMKDGGGYLIHLGNPT